MNDNLVKDIIEKIKLWWKNLFRKKKIIKKQQEEKLIRENQLKKEKYNIKLNLDNENKSSSIGTIYPKLSPKNKLLLNKKGNILRKKIENLELVNNEININTINNILDSINQNELNINQATEINNLLNNINNDNELNLNTNEKINILKDSISTIIDKKLDAYETNILKKAYNNYDDVNYVIMTTLLIDDIIDEINELNNDFKKNKYTKIEYERKIQKIKDKINKLEVINDRKEVQEEIENLRKDFYTKKKDKYDLLYNDEIFINLNNKCDELLTCITNKEKQEIQEKDNKKILEQKIEEKKKEEKKQQQELNEKKEEVKKEEKELNEKILKRFIDMEFAHKLLLLRERKRRKKISKEEIINETLNYYNDFILGEHHEFNFERNRIKTEVAKLYNDINNIIYSMENRTFIPLEHINIKLDILTEATLERQAILNEMIHKKHGYNIEETETNKQVNNKLTHILSNEKAKENLKENGKILKKEFNYPNDNHKQQPNCNK